MGTLFGILKESVYLLNKMSPYLLFGFIFAGVMHAFISTETVGKHLGKSSLMSVIKASFFGIPLPLCSCGVLPAAMSLKRDGASRGAVVSFLVSTPITGIDSILATYSLMGGFFAAYRVAASFLAAVMSGFFTNMLKNTGDGTKKVREDCKCSLCGEDDHIEHGTGQKFRGVFVYAFRELLPDIGFWLIAGILIGGAISYFMPPDLVDMYLGRGWRAMVLMLLIGIPMYVCATGSIPIAAALMLKGLSPGAAFVFLLAGPATNAAGMTLIARQLGKKVLGVYISALVVTALASGYLLEVLWDRLAIGDAFRDAYTRRMFPFWVEVSCSAVIVGCLCYDLLKRAGRKKRCGPDSSIG
jgi:hypothetical protein